MKKLLIELDGSWVFKHREDEKLPVQSLMEKLSSMHGDGLRVEKSTLTTVEFVYDDHAAPELTSKIKEVFASCYPEADVNAVLTIETAEADDNRSVASDDGVEEIAKKMAETAEPDSGETVSSRRGRKAAAQSSVMDEINALVGAEEFKALAHEISAVAPEIIKNNTLDVFTSRSYLFSINDGCGLTTYLQLLSRLFGELGLKKMASDPVTEEKIGPMKDVRDPKEPFECVTRKFQNTLSSTGRILAIDISEWMDKLDGKPFKDFLQTVVGALNEYFIVFRVPYLEKDVLDKIQYSLNDLLFIRTVAVAPFTNEELRDAARKSIEQFGFKVRLAAWDGFDMRITEEKSDGKFYGLNTVKKVVRELLYKKQLANAVGGKHDKVITAADTQSLCLGDGKENTVSGYEMLMGLVGSETLKNRVDEIVAQVTMALKSDNMDKPCLHMRFVGNPGTGKTTVARIIGKIFKEKGILRVGNFFEYSGRDFCGRYVGETAPKTAGMCRDAYGSVLFIDEAYSLYRGSSDTNDFGREALDTLIAEMENHRNDLVVIMAGYQDDMKKLMDGNVGLSSRMPYTIEFPNFSREELYEIFALQSKKFACDDNILPAAREYFMGLSDDFLTSKEFSNARFVRNLFERTWAKAVTRCQLDKNSDIVVTKDDFIRASSEKDFDLTIKKKTRIGF